MLTSSRIRSGGSPSCKWREPGRILPAERSAPEDTGPLRGAFSQAVGVGQRATQTPAVVAVEVAGRNSAGGDELTVLLPGGLRIEVKRGFDAGTLRQLIAVLEA